MYPQLIDGNHQTHLLTLLGKHPFRAELETVHLLGNVPENTALSYTWQIPLGYETNLHIHSAVGFLEIGGQQLPITANLRDAVYYLHAQKKYGLWNDAVCIDQTNTSERSDQVGLMRKIYGQAQEVVVWLGVRSDDSDVAMDHLVRLASLADKTNCLEMLSDLGALEYHGAWKAFQNLHRQT